MVLQIVYKLQLDSLHKPSRAGTLIPAYTNDIHYNPKMNSAQMVYPSPIVMLKAKQETFFSFYIFFIILKHSITSLIIHASYIQMTAFRRKLPHRDTLTHVLRKSTSVTMEFCFEYSTPI